MIKVADATAKVMVEAAKMVVGDIVAKDAMTVFETAAVTIIPAKATETLTVSNGRCG